MLLTTKRIEELTENALRLLGKNGSQDGNNSSKEKLSALIGAIAKENVSSAEFFSILRTRVGFNDFELAELDDAGLLPTVTEVQDISLSLQ